ncbi:MAG: hypothetical protein MUF06_13380 [Pirellulaceae bacterium]|jgi:hypothetical protein|nr:hypothetical protein [Pirellulaceae bacterium]
MTPAVTPFTRHFVAAPIGAGSIRPPALVGVDLAEYEDVEWIWQHTAEGQSQVTGYRIVPRLPRSWPVQEERRHG